MRIGRVGKVCARASDVPAGSKVVAAASSRNRRRESVMVLLRSPVDARPERLRLIFGQEQTRLPVDLGEFATAVADALRGRLVTRVHPLAQGREQDGILRRAELGMHVLVGESLHQLIAAAGLVDRKS